MKRSKTILLVFIALLGTFLSPYVYNRYKYLQFSLQDQSYKQSLLIPIFPPTPTYQVSVNQPVKFEWEITSPVKRKAQRTFVLYGSISSPSATLSESNPDKLPYTQRTQDYRLGDFHLPYRFDSTLSFSSPGSIYYRFYARVDGQDIYSPEYTLKIGN